MLKVEPPSGIFVRSAFSGTINTIISELMERTAMTEIIPPEVSDFYKVLPKIELHRHLEGSLRVPTMMEIVRAHEMDVKNTGYLRPLVQVDHDEPYTFENFLSKFGTLRLFYKSPDIIKRVSWEAVEDAALDNVRYMELRFTPAALSRAQGFPMAQVVDWVIESVHQAADHFQVMVRLIISINRHESLDIAGEGLEIAMARKKDGIVGVDLAGNEAEFSAEPFRDLFEEARQGGLRVTIHAGEWSGAENVRQAIEDLGADRIGHGIRVLEDPRVVALARERGTVFEVCVTSNLHSGVVDKVSDHPIVKMIESGLNVTINTDDPSISRINLSSEYQTVHKDLGISMDMIGTRVKAAAQGAFLPAELRSKLANAIEKEFMRRLILPD
ncbi:MAG TPA: adenosine deaminase [Chloroflexi bacterium]|nr:MAG: adenosine deaminase [Chloroflexota bacterium]HDD56005.1 adenosine deaminase [Chloroflexota bacterium]